MNIQHPERRDRLAAAYVLGTLRGAARTRFERAVLRDAALREAVQAWERRLGGMVWEIQPKAPPRRVWRGIRRRILQRRVRSRWLPWGATAVSTAAAVALAVALVLTRGPGEPDYLAVIGDAGASWAVAADPDAGTLRLRAVTATQVAPDRDLELWLLPGDDAAPISLGLLPEHGAQRHDLPADLPLQGERSFNLAVTREPKGGSPTGQPTGPVVLQGTLLPL